MDKAKKKRVYNPNSIKSKSTYTSREIAQQYGLHFRTVQNWIGQGLKPIDESHKPYLFLGEYVRTFLKLKNQKRRQTLNSNEFYCVKCRHKTESEPSNISITFTEIPLGKNSKQVFIRGLCKICNTKLTRFSSDAKIKEMEKSGLILEEHSMGLFENIKCSLNTDI